MTTEKTLLDVIWTDEFAQPPSPPLPVRHGRLWPGIDRAACNGAVVSADLIAPSCLTESDCADCRAIDEECGQPSID